MSIITVVMISVLMMTMMTMKRLMAWRVVVIVVTSTGSCIISALKRPSEYENRDDD